MVINLTSFQEHYIRLYFEAKKNNQPQPIMQMGHGAGKKYLRAVIKYLEGNPTELDKILKPL